MGSADKFEVPQRVMDYFESHLMDLKKDLAILQDDERVARSHGDLRENRAFELAREQIAIKQSQITSMQKAMSECEVTNQEITRYSYVELMTSVKLQNISSGEIEEVYIVIDALGEPGEMDFDFKQVTPDKISGSTVVGKALLHKPKGAIVKANNKAYKILDILPIDYEKFFSVKAR